MMYTLSPLAETRQTAANGAFKGRARAALPALIDGEAGAVWRMAGQVLALARFCKNSRHTNCRNKRILTATTVR